MPNETPNDDDLDLGGDYAREGGWSGAGRRDEYTRGPRHYQRSDEQIRDEVNEAITRDDLVDAMHLAVEVADGVVTLTGLVASRAEKRAAEECALRIGGVHDVMNALRVSRGDREVEIGKASE
jgi:osmotically-inducible protein OsmY